MWVVCLISSPLPHVLQALASARAVKRTKLTRPPLTKCRTGYHKDDCFGLSGSTSGKSAGLGSLCADGVPAGTGTIYRYCTASTPQPRMQRTLAKRSAAQQSAVTLFNLLHAGVLLDKKENAQLHERLVDGW